MKVFAFCRRPVSKDTFLKCFWECFETFRKTSTEAAGMPAYFRFLTLLGELLQLYLRRSFPGLQLREPEGCYWKPYSVALLGYCHARRDHDLWFAAFKTFIEEGVDVAVIEVGLGGRLDATNIVPNPVVCGISSLGYDHMELLGYTLTVRPFSFQF